ncbi:unnamed protein product [Owenia fusiformis]|uniref:Uncharacterized protein n=1 Tax=Owenia fusiformis TaxID=6347 RepID=A0A8J1U2D6_OWEFU|nr:unnamed protein product [Owenia fusiformis]
MSMFICDKKPHHNFYGYELLLLRKLQVDHELLLEIQKKLLDGDSSENWPCDDIPCSLWYLAVTLERRKERFVTFLKEKFSKPRTVKFGETLLSSYLSRHQFTELFLDGIFKYGDDNTLPTEVFKCRSVRSLSLKYNYLDRIPPDIGRMVSLEYLALTNNKLQNKAIPQTLIFCSRLHTLLLDNNLLDALPGFLLQMPSLRTVHRHGNHNYFKSTFMWYHTDVNERILPVSGVHDYSAPRVTQPDSMQFWAAKAVLSLKLNFYKDPAVAGVLKDYISDIYSQFNICGYCHSAKRNTRPGYKVITFKNPYLGNTCVPFQHWACSQNCSLDIEVPARLEQISKAKDLDHAYEKYIKVMQHTASNTALKLRSNEANHAPPRGSHSMSKTGCGCAIM